MENTNVVGMVILIGVIVLPILIAIWMYNRLVQAKNQVQYALSSIDVYLKKRFDLIPNLVEVTKRYMQYERQILEELTEMRTRVLTPGRPPEEILKDETKSTQLLRRLFAVAEGYPQLKASETFLQVQAALREVEDQLAASRRAFASAVTSYNNAIEMFPTSCMAAMMGYKKIKWFEAEEHERQNIDISKLW